MTTNAYDLNPTLAEHRTNAIRRPFDGGHGGCDLEVVTHLLYAEGQHVESFCSETGTLRTRGEADWEEVQDVLTKYVHCRDHGIEWAIPDYIDVVDG